VSAERLLEGTTSLTVYGLLPEEAVPVAQRAEAAGFDGLWLGEHVVAPVEYASTYPYASPLHKVAVVAPGTALLDIWVTFGAMAAGTSRIFLGSGVALLPLAHPLLTARATATLQGLARGRLIVGGGTGWLAEEFEALDVSFSDRGDQMDEILEILQRAWGGGPFSFEGERYRFDPLTVTPWPVDIPVVLGGTAPRALRRAARWADGWRSPSSASLRQLVELRDELSKLLVAAGRSPEAFAYSISLPDAEPQTFARYRAEGFTDLSLPAFASWRGDSPVPLGQKLADVDRWAEALGLSARGASAQTPP
jgi:probable F420-dependent oxidoreductase